MQIRDLKQDQCKRLVKTGSMSYTNTINVADNTKSLKNVKKMV